MGQKRFQTVPAGTPLSTHPPTLFQTLQIRKVTFHNRIWLSPMCMYSSSDGHLNDLHLVHYGGYALRGAGLTIIEATAVHRHGRISPNDAGIWDDSHVAGIKKVVNFVHSIGQKIGIQLGHAGRKASTVPLWKLPLEVRSSVSDVRDGGWPEDVKAPSAVRLGDGFVLPKELSLDEIKEVVEQFGAAAKRAVDADIDVIEIHGAHGYLLSSFLSALSNRRRDEYGGSFENRTRLPIEVVRKIRSVIPGGMPLFYRISGTEWTDYPNSWKIEDTIRFAKLLAAEGVDLLTVSSGGMDASQRISAGLDYQVDLCNQVRTALLQANVSLLVGAVGRVTNGEHARRIVEGNPAKADVVLVGRQFLRDPSWILNVAAQMGVDVQWPLQYKLGKPGTTSRL
ncbi:NADPH dehydrogenase [Bisporella sp. PMI_857]|nr:NADPH dehydrogenase [Bisporella sp. PMI_857]